MRSVRRSNISGTDFSLRTPTGASGSSSDPRGNDRSTFTYEPLADLMNGSTCCSAISFGATRRKPPSMLARSGASQTSSETTVRDTSTPRSRRSGDWRGQLTIGSRPARGPPAPVTPKSVGGAIPRRRQHAPSRPSLWARGRAGLACAQRLVDADLDVTLLEARHRMGGRVWTNFEVAPGVPVEMGALMVHGRHVATHRWARKVELLPRPYPTTWRARFVIGPYARSTVGSLLPQPGPFGPTTMWDGLRRLPKALARDRARNHPGKVPRYERRGSRAGPFPEVTPRPHVGRRNG